MNDTTQGSENPTPEPGGFASENLRSIAEVRRSSEDRIVAGVCAGLARHLNIDPIVVRIAIVALTFVGLAGLILYLAAWFLLPEDDEPKSVAADWFNLDRNEDQVRRVGLFVAAVLAVAAVVGDGSWGHDPWVLWLVLPVAFLFWLFVVRPRRRHEERMAMAATPGNGITAQEHIDAYTAEVTAEALNRRRARALRRRESRQLTRVVLSLLAIAEAVTLIVDQASGVRAGTYLAVAIGTIAVGCFVGTVWGRLSGWLIALGILLSLILAVHAAVPSGRIGEQVRRPDTISQVHGHYRHGVGRFELDLGRVANPSGLAGRTVVVDAGVGQTQVYVPDDVRVDLSVKLQGGEVNAFGRTWHGNDNDVHLTDGPAQAKVPRKREVPPARTTPLHLVINQRFGDVEVNRR